MDLSPVCFIAVPEDNEQMQNSMILPEVLSVGIGTNALERMFYARGTKIRFVAKCETKLRSEKTTIVPAYA
jgi:hypothetical protein